MVLIDWGVKLLPIVTVDYNVPDIRGVPSLTGLNQAGLAHSYAAGQAQFDVIVSFSGIEHDGLGRYGDPNDANGPCSPAPTPPCP